MLPDTRSQWAEGCWLATPIPISAGPCRARTIAALADIILNECIRAAPLVGGGRARFVTVVTRKLLVTGSCFGQ